MTATIPTLPFYHRVHSPHWLRWESHTPREHGFPVPQGLPSFCSATRKDLDSYEHGPVDTGVLPLEQKICQGSALQPEKRKVMKTGILQAFYLLRTRFAKFLPCKPELVYEGWNSPGALPLEHKICQVSALQPEKRKVMKVGILQALYHLSTRFAKFLLCKPELC